MSRAATLLAAATLLVALSLAATAGAQTTAGPLNIYAAASLTEVFQAFDKAQKYNFAGSNVLETQIRNGAPADIFASASPVNTQRLYAAGLVEKPVTFTANRLALIVPKSNPAGITSVYDLKTKDVKLVVANASVPVGSYTRTVLKKMALTSVLAKVVSQESDVKAVTGKVALGQADAGFVYATDAALIKDKAKVVATIPTETPVSYPIAVIAAGPQAAAGRRFADFVQAPAGQAILAKYGFGRP